MGQAVKHDTLDSLTLGDMRMEVLTSARIIEMVSADYTAEVMRTFGFDPAG